MAQPEDAHLVGGRGLRVLPASGGARIRETVRMTAPWPLAGYGVRVARAAHRDLLARLAERVEVGA